NIDRNRLGVQCIRVIRLSSIHLTSFSESSTVSRSGGIQSVPPAQSGRNISLRNGSKDGGVSRLTRNCSFTPNVFISQFIKCDNPRRLPAIPLGCPVEPEVKNM